MAQLKKVARTVRGKPVSKCDVSTDGVLELSVTIGYLAADVRKEEMALLEKLMQDHCVSGVVAMERGDLEQHLHFQMVCRARVTSARSFGVLVRRYMRWFGVKQMCPAGKVMCKVLTNRLIHTWKGMIGYCLKDSGLEHFEVAMQNISDEEVIAGKTLHTIYGKADLKNRVSITNKNIGERAYVWFKFKEKRQLTASFLSTLTDMVHSSMFYPASAWITPFGGQGMDQKKMNSYWKCVTHPTNVTKSEVGDVFVNKRQSFKNRYYDEEEDVSADEQDEEQNCSGGSGCKVEPDLVEETDLQKGVQCIPRTLAVPPLGSSVNKRVRKEQVDSARRVKKSGKRLFEEIPEVKRPRKSVTFSSGLLPDFVPLKERADLPTNVCLPTTDVLTDQHESRQEIREDAFWESVSNRACVLDSENMFKDVQPLSLVTSSSRDTGSIRVSTAPDPILLSSDSEMEDSREKRKRGAVIDISSESETEELPPACKVFEDRTPSSVGQYFASPDKISLLKVKREYPCNYYKCYSEFPGECDCVR